VVLNAKYHAQEAEIVAQAGRLGTVTIATNMAGRGTDILLGGNAEYMARQRCLADELAERLPKGEEKFVDDEDFVYFHHLDAFYRVRRPDWQRIFDRLTDETGTEHERVVALGGLHIIGTERHEARRIDNQLRGRAGRQGDPGSSRFYLSLEDDLMRIFGSDRISGLMQRLGMEEGVPIEHGMVTRAIERAQKQVESQNFSIRKHLLEYDDVMNKQRENIYALRRELLEGRIRVDEHDTVDTRGYLMNLAEGVADDTVAAFCPEGEDPDAWDLDGLRRDAGRVFGLEPVDLGRIDFGGQSREGILDALWDAARAKYEEKESLVGRDVLDHVARDIMLQIVDAQWKDHLYSLDHLKEGIGLRGYGQRDPLVEYKKESFALFQDMKGRIDEESVRYLFWLRPVAGDDAERAPRRPVARRATPMTTNAPSSAGAGFFGSTQDTAVGGAAPRPARTGGDDAPVVTVRRDEPKVGRNDPCPCGSGKKYKNCCMRKTGVA
jgi:preprotein translocase subunit SecA